MLDSFTVESPFVRRARRTDPRVRLFCFPHAGAGAATFAEWPRLLPPEVELIALQLPGREDRIREQPLTDLTAAVRTLGLTMRPYLRGPFAFFGHSGGALLAFELARALRGRGGPQPEHLLLSGEVAPDRPPVAEPIHELPDEEFVAALGSLGGTAESVAGDPELMRLLLPALRADFTLGERYEYRPEPPLAAAITVLGGHDDERAPEQAMRAWQEQTSGAFRLRIFEGGHFYLNDRPGSWRRRSGGSSSAGTSRAPRRFGPDVQRVDGGAVRGGPRARRCLRRRLRRPQAGAVAGGDARAHAGHRRDRRARGRRGGPADGRGPRRRAAARPVGPYNPAGRIAAGRRTGPRSRNHVHRRRRR
ncbi:thioesterase II family protein [Saccharopolyspora spinosporotrichia]